MPYKITTTINGEESVNPIEWKTVPRIGERVILDDRQTYKVTDVVHMFRRGIDAHNGEISIVLEIQV